LHWPLFFLTDQRITVRVMVCKLNPDKRGVEESSGKRTAK
jgi:hypothetical protein